MDFDLRFLGRLVMTYALTEATRALGLVHNTAGEGCGKFLPLPKECYELSEYR
jgi:hypothetical protein